MHEDIPGIFDYLPIRRETPENDYIEHLWQAFSALDVGESAAQSFSIMPLHLLFMLAIQYKVLRIYKEQKEKYILAMITKNPRNGEDGMLAPESPLAVAFLGESEIVDLLKIAGLSSEDARDIKKSIIRYRNDKIAHAKGYIEQDIETKLAEYLDRLESLQKVYRSMNRKVVKIWLSEIQTGDDIEQFLETHFLDSCFSSRDFGDIIGILLKSEKLDPDQWDQVVNKGLELANDQTIAELERIEKTKGLDPEKRKKMLDILGIPTENSMMRM
jgi:hypothetical protein